MAGLRRPVLEAGRRQPQRPRRDRRRFLGRRARLRQPGLGQGHREGDGPDRGDAAQGPGGPAAPCRPSQAVLDAVLKRAEKDEKDPQSADLFAWVATTAYLPCRPARRPPGPSWRSTQTTRAWSGCASWWPAAWRGPKPSCGDPREGPEAEGEGGRHPRPGPGPGREGATGLGDKPAEADKAAAEAEKYLTTAADLFGKDTAAQKKDAEDELRVIPDPARRQGGPGHQGRGPRRQEVQALRLPREGGAARLLGALVRPLPGHVPARAVAREEAGGQAVRPDRRQLATRT